MNTKRRLSPIIIVLVLAMMLSVVPMFTFASAADEGDFTVKFAVPDGLTAPDAQTGTSITLPDLPTLDGYTAVGWTEEKLPEETTEAPTFHKAGDTFTPTANTKLYALYSKTTEGDAAFKKYTGTITEGYYIISYENAGAKAADKNGRLDYVDLTISGDTVTNPDNTIIWRITKKGSNWTIFNESTAKYMYGGTKNKLSLNSAASDTKTEWTITGTSTYEIVNVYNKANNINANLRKNGTYGFATYATGTGGALTLYKQGSASKTVYTTTNVTEMNTVVFSAPAEFSFDSVTMTSGSTITLPTIPATYGKYTFVGWTNEVITNGTSDAPVLLNGEYEINSDETLYAVFSIVAEVKDVYTLVTDVSTLAAGDNVVIAAKDSNVAISTNQKSNNRGQATITVDKNTITFGNDVQVLTLANGSGANTFAFSTGNGYLNAPGGGNNLRTATSITANSSFTIAISANGVATIKTIANATQNRLLYNKTSSLFSCYEDGNNSQLDVAIYKEGGTATTYTTAPVSHTCEVAETKNENVVEATCTEAGSYDVVEYCECGKELSRTTVTVDALGHTNVDGKCSECGIYLEPTITGASLTLGADLSVNYYVGLPEALKDAEVKMVFTFNGKTVEVTEYTVDDATGRFVFSFTGIAPQCMTDNIAAELVINGETVDAKAEYSVYTYATNKLAEDIDDELRALLSDMLVYGAAAMDYTGYKAGTLVTDGITGFQASANKPTDADKADRSVTSEINANNKFTAAGVNFDYNNRIYVKFVADGDFTVTVGGVAVEAEALGNNTYIVYTDGILANQFADVFTFVLTVGDATQTLTYTVNAYTYSQYEKDNAMGALALALYNYGQSATAYAN